jgi:hypothetical protein
MRTALPLCGVFVLIGGLPRCAWAEGGRVVFPGKDWQEASPESQGVDPKKLGEAVAYRKEHSGRDGVDELVIVR